MSRLPIWMAGIAIASGVLTVGLTVLLREEVTEDPVPSRPSPVANHPPQPGAAFVAADGVATVQAAPIEGLLLDAPREQPITRRQLGSEPRAYWHIRVQKEDGRPVDQVRLHARATGISPESLRSWSISRSWPDGIADIEGIPDSAPFPKNSRIHLQAEVLGPTAPRADYALDTTPHRLDIVVPPTGAINARVVGMSGESISEFLSCTVEVLGAPIGSDSSPLEFPRPDREELRLIAGQLNLRHVALGQRIKVTVGPSALYAGTSVVISGPTSEGETLEPVIYVRPNGRRVLAKLLTSDSKLHQLSEVLVIWRSGDSGQMENQNRLMTAQDGTLVIPLLAQHFRADAQHRVLRFETRAHGSAEVALPSVAPDEDLDLGELILRRAQ